ncbi:glycerophosphodiester phosphodiesterase family protein [Thetidibacter halocola]|uniref:Glycerophosphodiester phosphodiesterase family protein n=1 Tax=Thetidibacter halocola TaxID=2827239 RepID=A0A8J8B933_9RHOB|nr:glycerophosphodiester phosphodiesterase family protein [Thetidibacter halocola]MBS0125145.1 glycerophosphodiester phosphodiesterase family protein [Thetidibacter halocola]
MLARLALLAFTLSMLPARIAAPADVESWLAEGQPPLVIAHRSAEIGRLPDNTLAWIEAAIALGVDALHVNPQQTADDGYVLMHDNTLNRTTDVEAVFPDGPPGGPTRQQRGGRDYVRDYTAADIARLRITDSAGVVHPVPTLHEALDLVGGRVVVQLGLKTYEAESLAEALRGRDPDGLLLMELYSAGSDQSRLRALADRTGIGVAASLYRSRDYLADFEALHAQIGPALRMVSVRSAGVTPAFLATVSERGVRVAISGWDGGEDSALVYKDDPGPWRAALAHGFSALTDQPERLLTALGR